MILLCEGDSNGIDSIVLNKILDNHTIHAVGSRFGMRHRIEVLRQVLNQPVYSILDRDFVIQWTQPVNQPIAWEVTHNSQRIRLGWFWERKEIENYLIDPLVVERVFAPHIKISTYQSALKEARDKITIYQAARMTLSTIGRTGQYYLATSMGIVRGNNGYLFPTESSLNEDSCYQWVQETCDEYGQRHFTRKEKFSELFEMYKTDFLHGGERYMKFLWAFSGKDLIYALEPWLTSHLNVNAQSFVNTIIKNLCSHDSISEWLPEWLCLKNDVDNYTRMAEPLACLQSTNQIE